MRQPQWDARQYHGPATQLGDLRQAALRPRHAVAPPEKKRRVLLWVFLAIQVTFLVWLIGRVTADPAAVQAAHQCTAGWQGSFKTEAACQRHYADVFSGAGNLGKGVGIALVAIFWLVVDSFIGLSWGLYRMAGRR